MVNHVKQIQVGDGIECDCFDVGDNIVYKRYLRTEIIKLYFERQKFLSDLGLAPKVISYDNKGYYCEKAKTWKDYSHKHWKFERLIRLVVNKMHKAGINFVDCHSGNIGIIGHHAVCIDVGIMGFRSDLGLKGEYSWKL